MRFFQNLIRYTLNNVVFGIVLMVLIAAYIAVGSGAASVREFFEMSELEFFDAWPLKVLMVLLCLNLSVVTLRRIPLTPPRYGVWCIHAGIITLIAGTSLYYHFKVEGRTVIPLNHTENVFYDSSERAMYARVMNRELYGMHPLPSLPRFGAYDARHGNADRLKRDDLVGISRFIPIGFGDDSPDQLSKWLGLKDPVAVDVIGFYPYADVVEDVVPDPASSNVGVEIKVTGPHGEDAGSTMRLMGTDPSAAHQFLGTTEYEFRQVTEASLADVRAAAEKIFSLRINLPGKPALNVQSDIGRTISTPDGVYKISIDSFDPAFPMSGTHELVPSLTLHVVSNASTGSAPAREFWRVILAGRDLQTDFKMDPFTTPPMVKGNRQKEPIDKDLKVVFQVADAAALLPNPQTSDKHVFLAAGDHDLLDIHTSLNAPLEVKDLSNGGQIAMSMDTTPLIGDVRRMDHFRLESRVVETPAAQQLRDQAEAGNKQVAMVRVSCGAWSREIAIPTDLQAAPDPSVLEPIEPWSDGIVQIPGASGVLQLQLGYTCRPMPASLRLKKFEMIHYPGGQGDNGPFKEFRSTLEITGPDGESNIDVASLNSPIYYDGGRWIFFQSGFDPDGRTSTIGVGNRPGVYVMVTGCIMIVMGLMYAFYGKPIVVRKMKANALAKAAANRSAREKAGVV